jgi:hypothetical protein
VTTYQIRVLLVQNFNDLRAEIASIGADLSYRPVSLTDELSWRALRLNRIAPRVARFLYQEMVLEGGEVILPARMDDRSAQLVDVLILGTQRQFQHLFIRIRTQNEDELNLLADESEHALATRVA